MTLPICQKIEAFNRRPEIAQTQMQGTYMAPVQKTSELVSFREIDLNGDGTPEPITVARTTATYCGMRDDAEIKMAYESAYGNASSINPSDTRTVITGAMWRVTIERRDGMTVVQETIATPPPANYGIAFKLDHLPKPATIRLFDAVVVGGISYFVLQFNISSGIRLSGNDGEFDRKKVRVTVLTKEAMTKVAALFKDNPTIEPEALLRVVEEAIVGGKLKTRTVSLGDIERVEDKKAHAEIYRNLQTRQTPRQ